MEILGIDIGGSGIKGAPVDVQQGILTRERHRIPTPRPANPQAVAKTVAEIAAHFNWKGPIGCGFPAAIQNGVALTASNIHKSWIGVNAAEVISRESGCPTIVRNDADVAGIAEMAFGAGKNRDGVVFMVTVGTGLG
ncbi:MAG: ROK family protein, partial [Bacteroidetes bacterium]